VFWADLTVKDAGGVAEFYEAVLGWKKEGLEAEGGDFNMSVGDKTVAGICHARGANAALPAQWLMYVRVKNVQASVDACQRLGGKVICPVAQTGYVLQDPAGAVIAILPAE
jgi:predicted enzyme related to lactoylglutathione lyase